MLILLVQASTIHTLFCTTPLTPIHTLSSPPSPFAFTDALPTFLAFCNIVLSRSALRWPVLGLACPLPTHDTISKISSRPCGVRMSTLRIVGTPCWLKRQLGPWVVMQR